MSGLREAAGRAGGRDPGSHTRGEAPLVAVLDYEAGNLRSAQRGLERAGARVVVTSEAAIADQADALCVPGVGHFGTCLYNLRAAGLAELVCAWVAEGRDVLGICVGMQLLYEHSEEGDCPGLGVLPGRVVRLPDRVRVPHIGWDVIEGTARHGDDPLLGDVAGERAYFVHSYYAQPSDPAHVVATCSYPDPFPCLVRAGAVVGTQFHPEKSAEVGARLLGNWVAVVRRGSRGVGGM
ncbi:MAG: imidazole glycerol phosphate synthase subunit HisH [Actinomycetota bacterium]|nr:imidazole glycerol phosphate synthase subunit HisH [Actinomycetota bacterium]